MTEALQIMELTSVEPYGAELAELLVDVVQDGGSIGFLPPLSKDAAMEYWRGVLQPGVVLWVARLDGHVCGSVQLHLALKQNAAHRAEVAKLMVHPRGRRRGIAKALMSSLESRAQAEGRSLLVLDTRSGDPSNLLYKSLGYIDAGGIPGYAKSADGSLDGTVFYYKALLNFVVDYST